MIRSSIMKKDVIAAVIRRGEKFLLGKRAPFKKAPEYWCPICGSIEVGESQEAAVAREVREETGMIVRAVRKVGEFDTHDRSAVIHWWEVEEISGEPKLANDEHTELGWFTPEEMRRLDKVFGEDIDLFAKLV